MSNKELTATQFNKDPAQFYRAAYDGETVIISHDHYGQGLFELTYRKRGFKPEKDQLTDEQKNALILEMTLFSHGANNGLTFELIEGAPGYVVISGPPDIATGKHFYRWLNYQRRNGFADSLEECQQKAREYAKCQSK